MGATYSIRSRKRASAAAEAALANDGILQHIFDYAGAGRWLYLAKVSKKWRECYFKAYSRAHCGRCGLRDAAHCTDYRHVFASEAALCHALHNGLQWGGDQVEKRHLRYLAGMYAGLQVLKSAVRLGLLCASKESARVLDGAAASGSLEKVKWLHEELQCPLDNFCLLKHAVRGGALDVVQYLTGLGVPDVDGAWYAVNYGHLDILQFLYRQDSDDDDSFCTSAADRGDLVMLKWLRDNGCEWGDVEQVACRAAESNSIEILIWLQQQGDILTERVMKVAVTYGVTAVVKWLHANECPWSDEILCAAAFNGRTDLFKWMHENDCPGNWYSAVQVDDIYWSAAAGGSVELLEYCEAMRGRWSAADLTIMLNAAGICNRLDAAKWLRERGANWPTLLQDTGTWVRWDDDMVQWAREQGCTSPHYMYKGVDLVAMTV
jgi:hypothetical protein